MFSERVIVVKRTPSGWWDTRPGFISQQWPVHRTLSLTYTVHCLCTEFNWIFIQKVLKFYTVFQTFGEIGVEFYIPALLLFTIKRVTQHCALLWRDSPLVFHWGCYAYSYWENVLMKDVRCVINSILHSAKILSVGRVENALYCSPLTTIDSWWMHLIS